MNFDTFFKHVHPYCHKQCWYTPGSQREMRATACKIQRKSHYIRLVSTFCYYLFPSVINAALKLDINIQLVTITLFRNHIFLVRFIPVLVSGKWENASGKTSMF